MSSTNVGQKAISAMIKLKNLALDDELNSSNSSISLQIDKE